MGIYQYHTERILIWGKTYPQLSENHLETVCTGGVLEDGRPIRLYPIPFRFMGGEHKFVRYQWITAPIIKDDKDNRPESHRIDYNNITLEKSIPSDPNGWSNRRKVMFKNPSWKFESVEELFEAQKKSRTSLGHIQPKQIDNIVIDRQSDTDIKKILDKLNAVKRKIESVNTQEDLFAVKGEQISDKFLTSDYHIQRIKIRFKCHGQNCTGHDMSVLDWEAAELLRNNGTEKTISKLEDILTTGKHDVRLFLGSIKNHPTSFVIAGIWYPKVTSKIEFDFQ